jgi:hypothetical protein
MGFYYPATASILIENAAGGNGEGDPFSMGVMMRRDDGP